SILKEIHNHDAKTEGWMSRFTVENMTALRKASFDPMALSKKRLPYEELDQRVQELLMGVI
ncbi:MAG TPA: hypothetical protein VIJ93_11560, partial [bacterium]